MKIPPTNLQYSSIYKAIYQLSDYKEEVFPIAEITVFRLETLIRIDLSCSFLKTKNMNQLLSCLPGQLRWKRGIVDVVSQLPVEAGGKPRDP